MSGVVMSVMLVAAAGATHLPPGASMRLTLDVAESPSLPDLAAFLRQRAAETWGAKAIAHNGQARFRVGIAWLAERSVEVRVDERGTPLAERILVVTDPGATKLTIWLLVKSTIKRAMKGSEPVALAPPPVEEIVKRRRLPRQERTSLATLITFSLGQPEFFSVGPAVGGWWSPWPRLSVGGEVGYQIAPGVIGLIVHHVPVRLSAGWAADERLTIGLTATVDLKIPVAERRTAAALGIETGGFAQLCLPLTRPNASFLLRATVNGRVVRQRYVIDEASVEENRFDLCVSTGVKW